MGSLYANFVSSCIFWRCANSLTYGWRSDHSSRHCDVVFLICKSSSLHPYRCYRNGGILLRKQHMYFGIGLTLGEWGGGTKSTMCVRNYNWRRSQVRKRGKIGLNQSLTYVHPFSPFLPHVFVFASPTQKPPPPQSNACVFCYVMYVVLSFFLNRLTVMIFLACGHLWAPWVVRIL